jgi:dTDP-glucose 4,6-dehydratase
MLASDLDEILDLTRHLWDDLRGGRLFITGGTGFFGRWLLESIAWAAHRLDLDLAVVVLSRDVRGFCARAPHLSHHRVLTFREGDIRSLRAAPSDSFTHILHAATYSSNVSGIVDPVGMFEIIVDGTRRVLELAAESGAHSLLFTSSGAVYGPQPRTLSHIPESYGGAPDPLDRRSAYGEGKRSAEFLCIEYGRAHNIATTVARCFSFLGPHLPLDRHYAAGNFLRDALLGQPIDVRSDGTSVRSYMYPTDLVEWLLTILLRGRTGCAYNVGSESAISVAELAQRISQQFSPPSQIRIAASATPRSAPERYVPSTETARGELGLSLSVDLDHALRRTLAWHRMSEA